MAIIKMSSGMIAPADGGGIQRFYPKISLERLRKITEIFG
jgi:hypothetical protein